MSWIRLSGPQRARCWVMVRLVGGCPVGSGMGDIRGVDWTLYKMESQRRGADDVVSRYAYGDRDAQTMESLTRIVSMVGGNVIKSDPDAFDGVVEFYREFMRAVWDEDEDEAQRLFDALGERMRGVRDGARRDAVGPEGEDRGVPGVQSA